MLVLEVLVGLVAFMLVVLHALRSTLVCVVHAHSLVADAQE